MQKTRETPRGFPHNWPDEGPGRIKRSRLSHIHLPDLFHQPLPGSSLFLFTHYAGLFVVLAFLHFRKNAGLFYLLLKAAQRDIEIIIVVVKKNSGQENHHLRRWGMLQAALKNIRYGLAVYG